MHLGNVIRRTRLLHSTLLLIAEASSNQLLLFADWVVLRTLIVAWKSRHTRVVVTLASFSCVLHLAALLLHSEAPSFSDSFTSFCPRPLGLEPPTRIVSPCFTRLRFQLRLSSRAPPDSTKRTRSTRSIWSWLASITNVHHSTPGSASMRPFLTLCEFWELFSCLQLGSFAPGTDMADVSPSSNDKTSFPRPQHEGQLRSSYVVSARAKQILWRITLALSAASQRARLPLNRGPALVEPSLSSKLSEKSVLGVASPLAHRRFNR